MKNRSRLPHRERSARSRAAQILHEGELIAGSLVTMKRTCGKKTCKCTRGEKHVSLYLALSVEGKRRMICIPADLEQRVRDAVEANKQLKKFTQTISKECVSRLGLQRKG